MDNVGVNELIAVSSREFLQYSIVQYCTVPYAPVDAKMYSILVALDSMQQPFNSCRIVNHSFDMMNAV
jgi:hypothetical protein